MKKKLFLLLIFLLFPLNTYAFPKIEFSEGRSVQFIQKIQLWNAHSFLTPNVNNTFIRRGRFAVKSVPLKDLSAYMELFYDGIGKDSRTITFGGVQDSNASSFAVRDLFLTWKIESSEYFNLSAGFFRPQIGRENIISSAAITSAEKALTSSYLRRHIVGRSTGRETGVNLGGLHKSDLFSFNYNFGFFDSSHHAINAKDGKVENLKDKKFFSPILASRISLNLGDPDLDKYKLGSKMQFFGKRDGASLDFNFSHQGKTDRFNQNNSFDTSFLINYFNFIFDSEIAFMSRETINNGSYLDQVFHTRLAYDHIINEKYMLQPTFMYSNAIIAGNSQLNQPSQSFIKTGASFYINGNSIKVSLEYLKRFLQDKDTDAIVLATQFVF